MGKYDLWNENTKRWADKYGAKIIKKYPHKGCLHKFELTVLGSFSGKFEVFECFTINPENDNKDGNLVVLFDGFDDPYCCNGNDINKFLKEYENKVIGPRHKLILKYDKLRRKSHGYID